MLPKVQVSNNSNTHILVWLLSCNKCIINDAHCYIIYTVHSVFNKSFIIINLVISMTLFGCKIAEREEIPQDFYGTGAMIDRS
jgi:hypothetical protein